jgi:ABC-type transport system involved in multi-copper enzyme maturation permease subunit
VYGPQESLHLVPLALLGDVVSTFIWISMLLAVGSLTKNTIVTAITALGLFLILFIALPIISAFAGPSSALNIVPGSGAGGYMVVQNSTVFVDTGTDMIGVNMVYSALFPSASVNFGRINFGAIQAGQTGLPFSDVLYTEPISLVAGRALAVAFVYIFVFLFIAWYALKRAQILE